MLQQLADAAFVIVKAEALADHALEIDPAPGTTPSTARSGPVSTISDNASSCAWTSVAGCPDDDCPSALRPCALKRCTQSLSVCRSMPPTLAASARLIPSRPPRSTEAGGSASRPSLAPQAGEAHGRMRRLDRDVVAHGRCPPATDESRHHRVGIPSRVSSAGRWYKS